MKHVWKMSGVAGAILIIAASCAAPKLPPHPKPPPRPPRPPHGPSAELPQQVITDLTMAYPQK